MSRVSFKTRRREAVMGERQRDPNPLPDRHVTVP